MYRKIQQTYAAVVQRCSREQRETFIFTEIIVLSVFLFFPTTASAVVNVTVNETIVPDHCEVSLSGLDAVDSLDWGNLSSESLSTPGAVSDVKTFNLSLTKCGNSYGSTVPTITVSGTAVGASSTSAEYLFRQPNSVAQGVGFILRFNDTSVTWIGGGKDPNLKNGTIISPSGGDLMLPGTWKSGTPIPIAVALSTGDLNRPLAGYVQGSVAFTFEYK